MFYLSVNISSSNSIFWNTMESSLFVGANLRGFLWLFLPTNLYLHELTSQRTMKSVATHQHWPPQIKMLPLYQTFVPFAQIIIETPKIVLMLKNFAQCLFQKFYSKLTSNIKWTCGVCFVLNIDSILQRVCESSALISLVIQDVHLINLHSDCVLVNQPTKNKTESFMIIYT